MKNQFSTFPAGDDTSNSGHDKNTINLFVILISTERNRKGGMVFPAAKQHHAFQIIGDSGAAQHCHGLDDITLHERCYIRKADVPIIFVTANGEVPCDELISTEILQLGITRDMYVMKDSPSVISSGRLVLDDG